MMLEPKIHNLWGNYLDMKRRYCVDRPRRLSDGRHLYHQFNRFKAIQNQHASRADGTPNGSSVHLKTHLLQTVTAIF